MKIGIKPSRPASIISVAVLALMIFFGLVFWFLVVRVLIDNEAPSIFVLLTSVFMIGWIGVAIYMANFHRKNIKDKNGEFLFEAVGQSAGGSNKPIEDPIQRLRSLQKLKIDGLITEEEFQAKREGSSTTQVCYHNKFYCR